MCTALGLGHLEAEHGGLNISNRVLGYSILHYIYNKEPPQNNVGNVSAPMLGEAAPNKPYKCSKSGVNASEPRPEPEQEGPRSLEEAILAAVW